jgi:hypothetical protein
MIRNYRGEMVHSTKYERELAKLKPYDEVQGTETVQGLPFVLTVGHGYLVVPKNHPRVEDAQAICTFGFVGEKAVYLEEDSEAREFLNILDV